RTSQEGVRMRNRVRPFSSALEIAAFAAVSLLAGAAFADPPPESAPAPAAPPPGYPPPPPGYTTAPPPAAPPPGYGYGLPGQPIPIPAGPKRMDYEEGEPIPPGYHKRTHIRKGLVAGGAAMFGAVYVMSVLIGGVGDAVCTAGKSDCKNGYRDLYIPLAG